MSFIVKFLIGLIFTGVFVIVFWFPGFFPIRAFDSVFVFSCNKVLLGDFDRVEKTSFLGVGGVPVRKDYLQCGVEPAFDANKICYVAEVGPETSFLTTANPLGKPTADDCDFCQYGWEYVKDGNATIGKSCLPYKFLWRWNYKSPF